MSQIITERVARGFSSLDTQQLAMQAGLLSTCLFSVVYMPQLHLNYTRKDTSGFSSTSMVIKLIGGAFLMVNAFLANEALPVQLYGLFGFTMYVALLTQIAYYNKQHALYLWALFPLVPLALAYAFPLTIALTNAFKPATQILSHLAQLNVIWQRQSTSGVALASQHCNWVGAWTGLFMCSVIPPKTTTTYFLYFNSVFQAGSFYVLVLWLDGAAPLLASLGPCLRRSGRSRSRSGSQKED